MKVLSIFSSHDSSGTLVSNGKVEKYFKEERYSRIKKDDNVNNIFNLCLEECIDDLDYLNINTGKSWDLDRELEEKIISRNKNVKFFDHPSEHHLYHATLSFYNSGFEKSLIVVIDAAGNVIADNFNECESIYIGQYPDKFTPIYKSYFSNVKSFHKIKNDCEYVCKSNLGVGLIYNTAALVIGQTIDDCGKAMGLSSYGSTIKNFPKLFSHKDSDLLFCPSNESWINKYLDNRANEITEENYKYYADYCYEIQKQTQETLYNLIKKGIEKTGIKNVCISGGYGMNIIANNYVSTLFPDVRFYFEPVCDDSGLSTGSALYYYRKITKDTNIFPLKTTSYHGIDHDISKYEGILSNVTDIAKLLYKNKSIAVYCGQAEAGQRALGNRSILFNALNPDAKKIINKIKKREWYRPFAAVVLEEDAHLYFDMGNIRSSPFMTMCFQVKCDIIPGVTHVDNTCRVQTVNAGHLYDILIEFKKISGHGILLNTSFNLSGEPLVETPEDAFNTLNNSNLDYLWFVKTNQLF